MILETRYKIVLPEEYLIDYLADKKFQPKRNDKKEKSHG